MTLICFSLRSGLWFLHGFEFCGWDNIWSFSGGFVYILVFPLLFFLFVFGLVFGRFCVQWFFGGLFRYVFLSLFKSSGGMGWSGRDTVLMVWIYAGHDIYWYDIFLTGSDGMGWMYLDIGWKGDG